MLREGSELVISCSEHLRNRKTGRLRNQQQVDSLGRLSHPWSTPQAEGYPGSSAPRSLASWCLIRDSSPPGCFPVSGRAPWTHLNFEADFLVSLAGPDSRLGKEGTPQSPRLVFALCWCLGFRLRAWRAGASIGGAGRCQSPTQSQRTFSQLQPAAK